MKTTQLLVIGVFATAIFTTACQKSFNQQSLSSAIKADNTKPTEATIQSAGTSGLVTESSGPCNSNAYTITLESHMQLANGNWQWIWSVQNPNPGNGKNGTVQNLSHWGMQFGSCFLWGDVSSAAYSSNGSVWTGFTPSYGVDPSQSCLTTPVLKFDYGTIGSAKTYYRLILTYNYAVGSSFGYYKSGINTGCCTFSFSGISCDDGGGPR